MVPLHLMVAMADQSDDARLLKEAKDAALGVRDNYTWDAWLRLSDESMIRAAVDAAFVVFKRGLVVDG